MKLTGLTGLVRPRGHHRAAPAPDMTVLAAAIATGDAEPGAMALCPAEQVDRYHALHADGTRTCWTCRCTTQGDQ